MEAAQKLKGLDFTSVTIGTNKDGNTPFPDHMRSGYYGGFKNGKQHGLGVKMLWDKYFAGNSSCCDYSSDWEAYNNGTLVWDHHFYSGGW